MSERAGERRWATRRPRLRAGARRVGTLIVAAALASAVDLGGARAGSFCTALPRAPGPAVSLLTPMSCVEVKAPPPPPQSCEFCSRLRDQVIRGCSQRDDGYSPYADSLFGRHMLAERFSDDVRRRLMAATLAQDPDVASEILDPVRASPHAAERYAANLVHAYALLRSNRADRIARMKQPVAELARDVAASGLPRADEAYLRAWIAVGEGRAADADAALEEALAAEPQFFGALALSAQLQLLVAVSASGGDPRTCSLQFRVLMARLQRVMDLAPCLTLAAHFEVFLSRVLADPGEQGAFHVAQLYLAVVSRRLDFARSRISRFENSKATCRAAIAGELHGWIAAVADWERRQ